MMIYSFFWAFLAIASAGLPEALEHLLHEHGHIAVFPGLVQPGLEGLDARMQVGELLLLRQCCCC